MGTEHASTGRPKIAVVGSGVSGLGAALKLSSSADVTLFERDSRPGGHVHTIDLQFNGKSIAVDTGFLVFNHRTYPNLLQLFSELDVETAKSEMSFSVVISETGLEWAGTNLNTVFGQRRNLLSPRFLTMLRQLLRFNQQTTTMARSGQAIDPAMSLGDFLDLHRYGEALQQWYLLPMAGAIWSCSPEQMREFPLETFIRFCDNHGLLQVNDRPQWYTVAGGGRQYVQKILSRLSDVRLGAPVLSVTRHSDHERGAVNVTSMREGHLTSEWFDGVVMACHSDQSLALLTDADTQETQVLKNVRYQPNIAYVHDDESLMPRTKRCWAAWNYRSAPKQTGNVVDVTYWINRLQPLQTDRQVFVSLNPVRPPAAARVFRTIEYSHPILDRSAIESQRLLPRLQGRRATAFAGAWCRYGFHEDGLVSGYSAARALLNHLSQSTKTALTA